MKQIALIALSRLPAAAVTVTAIDVLLLAAATTSFQPLPTHIAAAATRTHCCCRTHAAAAAHRLGWPDLLDHPFVRETDSERLIREKALADAMELADSSRGWKVCVFACVGLCVLA